MPEAVEEALEAKEKDKSVALIIAVLALFLALTEAAGKNALHLSMEKNIEASNLYSFYQAKKIRQTIAETAAKGLKATGSGEAVTKQIEEFEATAARYEKDPKKPQDSLERLSEQAHEAEAERDHANHRLEHYELASGLVQIAIVLASASIITGMAALMWMSVGLGGIGILIMAVGYFHPGLIPFIGG